jgi:hypothetical protein
LSSGGAQASCGGSPCRVVGGSLRSAPAKRKRLDAAGELAIANDLEEAGDGNADSAEKVWIVWLHGMGPGMCRRSGSVTGFKTRLRQRQSWLLFRVGV